MDLSETGIIWDMDGVLVDTADAHFAAWSAVLAEHGVPFDRESFVATFGMNNAAILRRLLGERHTPDLEVRIGNRKEAQFRAAIRGMVRPLPGELPGKPDPAVFLAAARDLGLSPARCLVVEDAVAGVEGARRAGMKCLAVTNTNPAALLSDADLVVDSLEELTPEAVERLIGPKEGGGQAEA
jgi:beta-phosphoglucomutase-like phosphatase (HAD superfamily)